MLKEIDEKFFILLKFFLEIEKFVKMSGGLIFYIEVVVIYC